jgi:hypothetical protein
VELGGHASARRVPLGVFHYFGARPLLLAAPPPVMPPLSRTSTLQDILAWLEQYEGPGGLSQNGITWKKPVRETLSAYIRNNDDVLPEFAPFAKAVSPSGPHVEVVKAFKARLKQRIQGQYGRKGVEQRRDSGELHAAIGKLHSLAIRSCIMPSC